MNSHDHFPESTPGAACQALAPLLPLVAQRLLEPDEAAAVRAHLAGCDFCRARLAAYDRLDDALRRHFEQISSSSIHVEERMSRIRDEEPFSSVTAQDPNPARVAPAPSAPLRPGRRGPRRVFSWVAAIAAVLVIALITTALIASRHPSGLAVKPKATATATPAQPGPSGVYFATTSFPPSAAPNTLYALKAQDGSVQWQENLPARLDGWPVLSNGTLYFLTRDYQSNTSENNAVYAMSASDGSIRWHTPLETPAQFVQIVDGVIYTGTAGGVVFALNAGDGSVLWQRQLGSSEVDVPLIVNNVAYVYVSEGGPHTESGKLSALNTSDGSIRWQYPTHGEPANINVVNGQVDVTAVFSQDGPNEGTVYLTPTFYALDASTGALRWSYGGTVSTSIDMITADANTVYLTTADLGSQNTTLLALDAAHGSVQWQKILTDVVAYSALSQGAFLYLQTNAGISEIDLRDGSEVWHDPLDDQAFPRMLVNSVLYVTSASTLLALNASDGSVKWSYPAPSTGIHAIVNNVIYGSSVEHPSINVWHTTIFALDASNGKQFWQYELDSSITAPVVG